MHKSKKVFIIYMKINQQYKEIYFCLFGSIFMLSLGTTEEATEQATEGQ